MARFSSKSSSRTRSNKQLRKGAGPVHYSWKPLPFEKGNNGADRYLKQQEEYLKGCTGPIDNNVTYVYEVLVPSGDHESYVECDYVD
jgi:hypothetical protein